MAKNRVQTTEDAQRQTRKEILIARKQAQQRKRIWLAMGGVGTLLILLFLIAIVNELFMAPNRAVAVVNGESITLQEWQDRVRYERAQRIIVLENQLEAFGGDVGIIQQFAGQAILELQDAEALGQKVLDQMVNEKVAIQLAQARGIVVSEADVEAAVGQAFNYYGGESPTAVPSPTETVVPTPSITPLATGGVQGTAATDVPEITPTPGPTSTPRPTATPVSAEAFQEQLADLIGQFKDLGVDEAIYRDVVRAQLYQERLMDVLADELALPREAEQVSLFYISYESEQEATDGLAAVAEAGFLTSWNRIRSAPTDAEIPGTASELLWRSKEDLAATLGDDVAAAAFELPVGQSSDLITRVIDAENSRYYIIQVSGREVRPLPANALEQKKFELMTSVIDQQLAGNLESTEFWRNRVPTQPVLDAKFLAPPTATPPQPTTGDQGELTPVIATPSDGS